MRIESVSIFLLDWLCSICQLVCVRQRACLGVYQHIHTACLPSDQTFSVCSLSHAPTILFLPLVLFSVLSSVPRCVPASSSWYMEREHFVEAPRDWCRKRTLLVREYGWVSMASLKGCVLCASAGLCWKEVGVGDGRDRMRNHFEISSSSRSEFDP
jgi:hypothetical protein